jgi:hypothetical protein
VKVVVSIFMIIPGEVNVPKYRKFPETATEVRLSSPAFKVSAATRVSVL